MWAGSITGARGIYAQGMSVKAVRQELSEILEENLLLAIQNKKKINGFSLKMVHA
ncbi:MAG: hypothetical protein Q7K26_02940 [bacterium]|nr:hypothetical protein [bacterium]